MAPNNILSYFCKARSTVPSVSTAQSGQPTCGDAVVSDMDVDNGMLWLPMVNAGDNIDNGSCGEMNKRKRRITPAMMMTAKMMLIRERLNPRKGRKTMKHEGDENTDTDSKKKKKKKICA